MTGCKHCNNRGWYWKQPLPLSLIPAGNYGRLGNEVKAPCPWCRPGGILSHFPEEE